MTDTELQEALTRLDRELKRSQSAEKELGELLDRKLNEIYVHYNVLKTIGSLLDLQEMLGQSVGVITKSLPIDRVSVYLLDEGKERLDLAFASGPDMPQKATLRPGQGAPGRIVETGERVDIHDLASFYETSGGFVHHPGEKKRDGSYLGIPLVAHDATIGVIGFDNGSRDGLSAEERDFLIMLSHQIAAGIEKSLLFSKLQHLSQRDGLTGLFNHQIFQERLLQEISRRNRTRKPLSLLMFDIDHFKCFNDEKGHQAGDAVLKELSQLVTVQTRSGSTDVCCRYGGEEFAVILAETEPENAVKVAERIRKAVADHPFPLSDGRQAGPVTISVGVACVTGEVKVSPEELVKQADDALYQSKRDGRNQVSYRPQ